jgi:hypothetical protein
MIALFQASLLSKIHRKAQYYFYILPYYIERVIESIESSLFSRYQPPQSIADQLRQELNKMSRHLDRHLFDHFIGTYRILKKWNSPEYVCLAGLAHALYGTESFRNISIPLNSRSHLREIIGEEAERLVYYYCVLKRQDFCKNLDRSTFSITSRIDGQRIPISKRDFKDITELFLADRLEQIFSLRFRFERRYFDFFIRAGEQLPLAGFLEFQRVRKIVNRLYK